jgi:hypothetical protein
VQLITAQQYPAETGRDRVTRAPEPRPVTGERSGGGEPWGVAGAKQSQGPRAGERWHVTVPGAVTPARRTGPRRLDVEKLLRLISAEAAGGGVRLQASLEAALKSLSGDRTKGQKQYELEKARSMSRV